MRMNITCFLLCMFLMVVPGLPSQDQSAVKLVSIISSDAGILVTVNVMDADGNSKSFGHRLTVTETTLWAKDPKTVILGIYALAYKQLTADLKTKANVADVTVTVLPDPPTLDDYKVYTQANP